MQSYLTSVSQNLKDNDRREISMQNVRQARNDVRDGLRYLLNRNLPPNIAAAITANVAVQGAKYSAAANTLVGDEGPLGNVVSRVRATTDVSLDLFTNLQSEILGSMKSCFNQPTQQAGQVFASSVYLLSSFIASGHTTGGAKIAQAISSIAEFAEQVRLQGAISRINELEYMASVRCLVESTFENYCQMIDANELQKAMMATIVPPPGSASVAVAEQPLETKQLAGIYVLTHHIPVIMNYIHRLLLGVRPNTPQEADFQITILNDINEFQTRVKSLQGTLAQEVRTITQTSDPVAKANQIVKLVADLTGHILSDRSGKNFFLFAMQTQAIPFYFLGINPDALQDRVPEVFSPQSVGLATPMNWQTYLTTYGPTQSNALTMLRQPDEVIKVIEQRVNQLIESSSVRANEYYGQWFLADPASLIDEAIVATNMRYSFMDSLIAVQSYTKNLETRLAAYNTRPLPSMFDTRQRIQTLIDQLNEFRAVDRVAEARERSSFNQAEAEKFRRRKEREIAEIRARIAALTGWQDRLDSDFANVVQQLSATLRDLNDEQTARQRSICRETPTPNESQRRAQQRQEECQPTQLQVDLDLISRLNSLPSAQRTHVTEVLNRMIGRLEAEKDLLEKSRPNDMLSPLQNEALKVLTNIYIQLNILLSRSTFLPNRLEQYVLLDYNKMIENGVTFTDYQRQLMIVLGPTNLLPEAKNVVEANWAIQVADIRNAAHIASENVNRLEEVFRDNIIRWTRRASILKDHPEASRLRFFLSSFAGNFASNADSYTLHMTPPSQRTWWSAAADFLGAPNAAFGMIYNSFVHSGRYDWNPLPEFHTVRSPDSRLNPMEYLWAQTCVLSLGFHNQAELPFICKDAVLKDAVTLLGQDPSALGRGVSELKNLSVDYNQRVERMQVARFMQRTGVVPASVPNTTAERRRFVLQKTSEDRDSRICALRTYYRENQIFQISVGMRNRSAAAPVQTPSSGVSTGGPPGGGER
jgi:hypothetical protein